MLEIIWAILESYAFFIIHPFFYLVIFLIAYLYHKMVQTEVKLLGWPYNDWRRQIIPSLVAGFAGGFIASLVLVLPGFYLSIWGIYLMLIIAIMLLTIHPRFLCFAYSVGIVSVLVFLARLLVNDFPGEAPGFLNSLAEIYIPGMLVLVAALHLTEAVLIYLSGHLGASPVFYKSPGGKIVGGFRLQRFWPVPLVLLIAADFHETLYETIEGPGWWPLSQPDLAGGMAGLLLVAAPVAMGYADMAISSTPREKSIYSSCYLAIYSLCLLGISLASVFHFLAVPLGIIFAPLGHEIVVYLGNKREMECSPIYTAPEDGGVKVLAVYSRTSAEQAGLQSGDVIREVNREKVHDTGHFWRLVLGGGFWTYLLVERDGSQISVVMQRLYQERKKRGFFPWGKGRVSPSSPDNLGLVLVPDTRAKVYLEAVNYNPWNKLKKWLKRR